mmetsp:Transcript_7414/g.18720  ORF Transcript_7414/g.18720 Transcript_7414/m.18720 type:complete len:286 (-) Transcript_7414:21-878(-)
MRGGAMQPRKPTPHSPLKGLSADGFFEGGLCGSGPRSVRDAVHPDVLVEELLVEVAPHRVIDVALLHLRCRAGLVFEDSIVVPLPLEAKVTIVTHQQRIALRHLISSRPIVHLVRLRLVDLLLGLALLLDLSQFPHQLLCVLVVVIIVTVFVGGLGGSGSIIVLVLRERVGLDSPQLGLGLSSLRLPAAEPEPLLPSLLLLGLELLTELLFGASLLDEALAGLARLDLQEARRIAVGHLGGLATEGVAARIRAAGDGGAPCWSVRAGHRCRRTSRASGGRSRKEE